MDPKFNANGVSIFDKIDVRNIIKHTLIGTEEPGEIVYNSGSFNIHHHQLQGLSDDDHTQYVLADGERSFTQPVGGITPTDNSHLATKGYVDAVGSGLDVKSSCKVATIGLNITLNAAPNSLDNVNLQVDDRILVKDQSNQAQNGIYIVQTVGTGSNGVWVRSTDFDGTPTNEVTSGAFTFVTSGDINGGNGWVITTSDPITVGSTNISWAQFSGAGQVIAGNGLIKSGNTINVVGTSGRISINADNIDLSSGIVTPGTYPKVTVDTYGRVTSGSTTIATSDLPTSGSWTLSDNLTITGANLSLQNGTGINEFSIDGTLSGDSDVAVPTEKAVKSYVDTTISTALENNKGSNFSASMPVTYIQNGEEIVFAGVTVPSGKTLTINSIGIHRLGSSGGVLNLNVIVRNVSDTIDVITTNSEFSELNTNNTIVQNKLVEILIKNSTGTSQNVSAMFIGNIA